ncbi:MAG: putative pre-16S rRNA nuclease [Alphaproteobacteria bacterium]|nr:MAG: putative pre-16S rRNA nuclease [Alphaproteobacteria bacterium]
MSLVVDISELKPLHRPGLRLFGVDLGTRTIGLALSDGLLTVATPYRTLKRTKFTADAAHLRQLCEREGVFALVVGLPLNMDGSEGPRAQATRAFVRNLEGHLDLPVVLWDERLSTVAAERAMIAADLSRRKRAEKIDAVAAAFILQGALDRLARL